MSDTGIFKAAVKLPPESRAAYLDQACGTNHELRREVESLLAAHDQPGSFLESRLGLAVRTVEEPSVTEKPGTVIGSYKLLQQIGEGGMGVVFLAEQERPVQRRVALKVIKPGMDSRQIIARFEAERQALALMDHPNIAHVYDGGATATGRPYLVMELVRGISLTDFCDQERLAIRVRLELFVAVCQAVQHAHQKGIIHRDIKPSNVLVTLDDGSPVVKVIDFGIAKALGQQLTDKKLSTNLTQILGTPLYMSPEQAGMSDLDVDTRSDVYSLGVLLYELLTGTTPFDKERLRQADYDEVRRVIREEEPARPSTRMSTLGLAATTISTQRQSEPKRLRQLFRGELDWIVMKCLEKDRNRRYGTASALAADVRNCLNDQPVRARPPSAWYQLRKFTRRHKTALALTGMAFLFAALFAGEAGWAARERAARGQEQARQRAVRQARLANDLRFALDQAGLFQDQGKRSAALAALSRAELLAGEVSSDPFLGERLAALKARFDAQARDEAFIARFQEIRVRMESGVHIRESQFSTEIGSPEIREALRRYGITIGATVPAQAAALIQARPQPVRRDLVEALDECLTWASWGDSQTRQWLMAALVAADPDTWRMRVRRTEYGGDWKALEQPAREADPRKQPPGFLLLLARRLPARMRLTRLALLRRIQRAYPGDLWANHDLALELHRGGQSAEAIRYFTAALALAPGNPGIYLNLGGALKDAGEVDAAIADFRQALALAPKYAAAHNNLGIALVDNKRLDEATKEFRLAVALDSKDPKPHLNLGHVLCDKNQWVEGIRELRRAAALCPNDATANRHLADTCVELGQWNGAAAPLARLAELEPDHHTWWYLSAALRLQTGDVPGYRRACREMLMRFGKTEAADVAEQTAKSCLLAPHAVRDLDSVLKLAGRAVRKNESNRWIQLTKALAEYRAGRYARAIVWLQRVAPQADGGSLDATALAVLAMARSRQGQRSEARKALDQAEAILTHKLPKLDKGQRFGGDWHNWLRAQILCHEATLLLGTPDKSTHRNDRQEAGEHH